MPDPRTAPSQRYADGVGRGDWLDDPAQYPALHALDRIDAALRAAPNRNILDKLLGRGGDVPRGLYLWGGVGRGKTFLIDLFFEGLPLPDVTTAGPHGEAGKRRIHFHRFMREVHAQLRAHAGESDPLLTIARELRQQLRVLVLDEFFVNDIGDAMLLGRLLQHLFAEGVVLVTSSNTPPHALYKDGLQRVRFLPAIALIEQHCMVLKLDSGIDYRLRALAGAAVYRSPLDADSQVWLQARWRALGGDSIAGHRVPDDSIALNSIALNSIAVNSITEADRRRDMRIEVEGRHIPVHACVPGMVWFDFADLCEGPRGSSDYIEIAQEFHTVLLGGIPVMGARDDDAARRFVTLIDELYDRNVNLVCTAAAAPPALYTGERLTEAFARAASRLMEMRTAEYFALEHRG